jgi:hypothetical protein
VVSLFASFLASSNGTLPETYGKINLNILPAFLPKAYSIVSFCLSVLFVLGFCFFDKQL